MNFNERELEDYLLPDAEALDELALFDEELPHAESDPAPTHEEWPQI